MITIKNKEVETKPIGESTKTTSGSPQILKMEKKQLFCDNDLISLFMGLLRVVKNSVYAEFETKIVEMDNEIRELKAENKKLLLKQI